MIRPQTVIHNAHLVENSPNLTLVTYQADPKPMMEMAVVLPTLNEAESVGALIDGILEAEPRLHVVVVDDGSSDGTINIVKSKARESQRLSGVRVHLIERGRKLGYASAIKEGMAFALQSGASLVLQMDADLSHSPSYLAKILEQSENHDLVIGSRYVPQGGTKNWGLLRRIMSRGGCGLARTLLNLPARDCTGGFRCWKSEAIRDLGILNLDVEGYAFMFASLNLCGRAGLRVAEIPIIFEDRRFGASKMSSSIILESAKLLFQLWIQRTSKSTITQLQTTPIADESPEISIIVNRAA